MRGKKFSAVCDRCAVLLGTVALAGLGGCVIQVRPDGIIALGPEPAPAVVYQQAPPVEEVPAPAQPGAADADMEQLVAPIALYPDPLLGVVLPASTYPDQIQAAAQWLSYNPSPDNYQIDQQPWDPSVKALVHYPSVLTYMNNDIDWTRSLGSAVAQQQPAVTAAVQDLRNQAYEAGNLHDTPEQRVIVEGDPTIYILPADPDFVYVPVYDASVVYVQPYPITFGVRFVTGVWFINTFDWDRHYFYAGDWHGGWVRGDGRWHRDPYWHRPYYHAWAHDGRWGPAPFVARDHWAVNHELARPGHEFRPMPSHVSPFTRGSNGTINHPPPSHQPPGNGHPQQPANKPQPKSKSKDDGKNG
jgi:hypothetical protein